MNNTMDMEKVFYLHNKKAVSEIRSVDRRRNPKFQYHGRHQIHNKVRMQGAMQGI